MSEDSALPVRAGLAKRVKLGPRAIEIVAVEENSWNVSERLGSTLINHGRMTFRGRTYTISFPGGAQSTAVDWEQAIRQHLGIR